MSKFDGKFRKNKDYQEDNEIAANFVKFRKRNNEGPEVKKVKIRNHDNSHKRYGFNDGWDG